MIVRRMRIGEQNSGQAGGRQLRQGGAAGAANGQIAAGQHAGQIAEEGMYRRVEVELAVQFPRGRLIGLARAMNDLPIG